MDNLDESENNAKISDSAYSNSCSNSQSRKSHSSTHSGSHSSRSSGYGGKQFIASSNNVGQPSENWKKNKNAKKKKQVKSSQNDQVDIQAGVEFRLPNPASACEVKEEVSDVLPESSNVVQDENGVENDITVDIKSCDDMLQMVTSNAPQPQMQIVMSEPTSSDGFSCVISMHDGVVVYATTSLTNTLGFPKDMWIGRSFIDFIHPLDHDTFASQITSGVATPKKVNFSSVHDANSMSTMFCRIRRFRMLTTGFGVTEQTVGFMPFMLNLSFKNINEERGVVIYLVIQAIPQFSAFKSAHEFIARPVPFVMRHVSNGNLEYIDHESVPLLGYLPQDVTGKDVLRLYHPDDLVYVRQVYETIMKEGGAPRSKPYRFMAQNGHYLKLETEWSSFINPWSRKLEFVVGKHHVVEGPEDPDVFQPPVAEKTTGEAKNKAQGVRDSIVRIMNEVLTIPAEIAKQQMTKRCQDLASFMESLLEQPLKLDEELRIELPDNENSYYERDSVMLGGISPHHDYDGNSSTTTPVSYNQLNFNENLQRYFSSHQQISYDDDQETQGNVTSKDATTFSGGCMSPTAQQSGDSAELTSSGESTGAAVAEISTNLPRLTASLLNKHNSEMEKSLVMQHRECRTSTKENREKASIDKQNKKDHLARCNSTYLPTLEAPSYVDPQPHGLKRASKPLEGEMRSHKHLCTTTGKSHLRVITTAAPEQSASNAASAATSQWQHGSATAINAYVTNTSMSQQLDCRNIMSSMTTMPGMIPMYYVPSTGPALPSSSEMNTDLAIPPEYAVPHLQYMMYGQAIYGAPLMMSPLNAHVNYPTSSYSSTLYSLGLMTSNYEEANEGICKAGLKSGNPHNLGGEKEPSADSMALSSKVDQGSGNSSSICSTSNALNRSNKAAPNSSDSPDSKMKAPQTGNSEEAVDRTDGESSYSSFYSSFFKTESGSATDSGDAKKSKNGANLGINGSNHGTAQDKVTRRKREPPWMEQLCVTSELVYKYQMLTKPLTDVLTEDKQKIISIQQPSMVNEQLGQLYRDMELEGVAARLTLDEGGTSSGSSGEEAALMPEDIMLNRSRRKRRYGKLVMIYEEDAPMPSPCGAGGDPDDPEPEAALA